MIRPVQQFEVRMVADEGGDAARPAGSGLNTPLILVVAALAGAAIGGILPLMQGTGDAPMLTAASGLARDAASMAPAAGPH